MTSVDVGAPLCSRPGKSTNIYPNTKYEFDCVSQVTYADVCQKLDQDRCGGGSLLNVQFDSVLSSSQENSREDHLDTAMRVRTDARAAHVSDPGHHHESDVRQPDRCLNISSPAHYATVVRKGDSGPDFDTIRKMCESNEFIKDLDLTPHAFKEYRISNWPAICDSVNSNLVYIYDVVKASGMPNALNARLELPTKLNLEAWLKYQGTTEDDKQLLDFVQFGFPLGYMGPISNTQDVENHPSAVQYSSHIDNFIEKELQLGGIVGSFPSPPFRPWCHVSPLMSREKRGSDDRRIISDMTFPREYSVNSYIYKNTVFGDEREHVLPTIDALVQDIISIGPGTYLSTLDVSRAYKNFKSDPLDWPLLVIKWSDKYYCDISMPFGARTGSCHMQRVANYIVRILKDKGVHAKMYLDDLILVSHSREQADQDFKTARDLLQELGLPEARGKAQYPSQEVTWLGVYINTRDMTLSVPEDRLAEAIEQVKTYMKRRSMNKKQLRSLVGKLLHVAKCIKPARLFVSKLLEALRGMTGFHININAHMRDDLRWFYEFAAQWNGISYITAPRPNKVIYVDACLSGIGAADEEYAYSGQIAPVQDGAANISEIEAVNVVIALHTFVSPADRGAHIKVRCDNLATVQVLRSGRGRNKVILECARAIWMHQAICNVDISYDHVPGVENCLADVFSRAHLSRNYYDRAAEYISTYGLNLVMPCDYILDMLNPLLYSRSGAPITSRASQTAPGVGKGPWYCPESSVSGRHVRSILRGTTHRPKVPDTPASVCLPRVHSQSRPCTRDCQKPRITCAHLSSPHGVATSANQPSQGGPCAGGYGPDKKIRTPSEGPHPYISPAQSHTGNTTYGSRDSRQGSSAPHVLRSVPPRGNSASISAEIPKYKPPHKRRSAHQQHVRGHCPSAWENHSEVRPDKKGSNGQSPCRHLLPSQNFAKGACGNPNQVPRRTTVDVSRHSDSHADVLHQKGVVRCP